MLGLDIINIFLHLDKYLDQVVSQYHSLTYLILFVIVFCETGLVVTPFLPGDSLLLAAGTIAGRPGSGLDVEWVWLTFFTAAIVGDNVNYWIGRKIGPRIFQKENVRLLNKKHLREAHAFYERHGGKTVAIARFAPILRTFAPFVAGIGKMHYGRFIGFSIAGTVAWVSLFVLGGWKFGSMEFVQKHFSVVVLAVIAVSLIPAVVGYLRSRYSKDETGKAGVAEKVAVGVGEENGDRS